MLENHLHEVVDIHDDDDVSTANLRSSSINPSEIIKYPKLESTWGIFTVKILLILGTFRYF